MKHKITFLFLVAGIIIYAITVAAASVSNLILLAMCICMLIIIRKNSWLSQIFPEDKDELLRIINTIPMPIFIKDVDNNIVMANKEFLKLFQFPEETSYDTITKKIYSLCNIEDIKKEDEKLKKSNKSLTCEQIIHQENEIKKYYVNKAGIYDKHKRLKSIIIFIKSIETHTRDCNNEDLIATLTHDLKTPAVAQIRGIELLLNGYFGEINDRQRNFLTDIWQSGNYMLSMLMDMLWLYKFDNKKISVNVMSFNVNELIREILKENKLTLNIKNSNFIQKNQTAKIHILADKSHIKRIIHNILINAVTHSVENSIIYIDTDIKNNEFVFQVTNQGKYIPKELMKCMFDRNSVFNQKCNGLSTGLGLYLSNSLLELNGGKFICESTEEGKNTFGFIIKIGGRSNKKPDSDDIKTTL